MNLQPPLPIERHLGTLDAVQFHKLYVDQNKPVILSSCCRAWLEQRDVVSWDLATLANLCPNTIFQNVFVSEDGRFKYFSSRTSSTDQTHHSQQEKDTGLQKKAMTLTQFLDKSTNVNDQQSHMYIYGEPLPPTLQPFFPLPQMFSSCQPLTSTLLWLSLAPTLSPLHYDLSHGLLTQLQGEKQILLIPPEYFTQLKPHPPSHPHDRQSSITIANPHKTVKINITTDSDSTADPAIQCYSGTVYPGDTLFLPYGWWHEIIAPAASISITHRWNPYEEQLRAVLSSEKALSLSLPANAIVNILSSQFSSVPDYVSLWYMRRSVLRETFLKANMLKD